MTQSQGHEFLLKLTALNYHLATMIRHSELLPEPLPSEPLVTVNRWLAEAWQHRHQPNPNAMVLATADRNGRPSARVVLCKELVPQPGFLVFYTNYLSHKGRQLKENPRAAAVLHWDQLHRQVRVEGPVVQAPAADSDAYFASRPWQSRVGAWASAQSEAVASRELLQEAVTQTAQRFGTPLPGHPGAENDLDIVIPRPAHWGGYHLWAETVELWVEGEARIHDRAQWTRKLTPQANGFFEAGPWTATRLQP
jgi:pyridoxamine 5'-phosphate oxidase